MAKTKKTAAKQPVITREMLRARAKVLGLTFKVTDAHAFPREMRINVSKAEGGTEGTAYYTQDAEDCYKTMCWMANERDKRLGRPVEEDE